MNQLAFVLLILAAIVYVGLSLVQFQVGVMIRLSGGGIRQAS